MSEIALRVYIALKKKKKREKQYDYPNYDKVFVFDTETTSDEYQNLKFGSFAIYSDDVLLKIGLFYNLKFISEKEFKELKKYCRKNPLIKLYSLEEFIEKIFYPTVYKQKVLCVGFNLPFDLSRLAFDYSCARRSMKGGFVLKLHKEKKYPPIVIKHNSNMQSFIKFQSTSYSRFSGYFLDLKTLGTALTDERHLTLERACELLNKKYKKLEVREHGKITQNYIEYNIRDTLATAELFRKMKEEFAKYGINIPLTEIYSSASIGKACLQQLGIKPFMELNPDFPQEILGYLMAAYYGGRTEVKIRKTPTKVTVIDFLSMYPTMFILMGLWSLLIAERIECVENTKSIKNFVENITLNELRKKETWKKLNAIVQVLPENDILPVRMKYDEKEHIFNIGVNYITSKIPLWYTLADIIVSKLLTGKTPRILKAIRFFPIGKQQLNKAKILGIEINPNKENLFKILIEKRQEFKSKGDFREKPLKILANASSYGIFVEINTKSLEKEVEVNVYSDKHFTCKIKKLEELGKYFNPIIAVMITGGARLVLGIAETLLKRYNQAHVFCDTDSIAVPSKYVKFIQDFFQPLNPYNFDKPLFKIEEKNVWFYGISAKRYVLYRKEGNKFFIQEGKDRGYSLHGLGHLLNPFGKSINWHKMVWEEILKLHYKIISQEQFIEKYLNLFAISKLSVSTPEILKRFKELNKNKPYKKQIKPFNFFLIGISNKNDIKPISPYCDNPQEIVHKPFIDYKTGKILEGLEYWKSLSDTLWEYIEHKESKLNGDIGILKRKRILAHDTIYIGKETENVKETEIIHSPSHSIYWDEEKLKKKILKITSKEAKKFGINKVTLWKIKKKIKENKPLRLTRKIKEKFLSCN